MIRSKLFLISIILSFLSITVLGQVNTITVPLLTETGGSKTAIFNNIYKGGYVNFKGMPSGLTNQNSIIRYCAINNIGDTLFMIIGDLNETERICIIDADMNKDFSNNYWYVFNKQLLSKNTVFPTQPFVYTTNHQKRETRFIRPELINHAFSFNGPDKDVQIKYYLALGISDYYFGYVHINNHPYSVIIYPSDFHDLNEIEGFSYSIQDSTVDITNYRNINNKPKNVKVSIGGFVIKPTEISSNKSSLTLEISPVSKESSVESTGAEVGLFAPNFKKQDLNNRIVDLGSFKGKYVLMDFWGTWCNPCVKLLPHLAEIHNKYKELVIISLASEMNQEGVNKLPDYIRKYQMDWINICDKDFLSDEKVKSLYHVSSFPTTILIDPEGKIIHRGGTGDINQLDEKLEQIFQQK